jgi:hypothetical protein
MCVCVCLLVPERKWGTIIFVLTWLILFLFCFPFMFVHLFLWVLGIIGYFFNIRFVVQVWCLVTGLPRRGFGCHRSAAPLPVTAGL